MSAETISVQCHCGKKLKAPSTAAGKKAKCPGCGNPVLIPTPLRSDAAPAISARPTAPKPAAVPKSAPVARAAAPVARAPKAAPPPDEDNSLDALYDLAADASQAHQRGAVESDDNRCPQCKSPLDANAVLCVNCGYNLKSGKSLAQVKVPPPPKPVASAGSAFGSKTKPADAMAPTGSLLAGIGVSTGFAAGAGLVMFLISWATGWDIFFLTLLIGVAAGLGMQMGQKGYSKLGGVLAAVITLAITIAARAAVIVAVVLPILNEDSEDSGDYDDRVVHMLTEETLKTKFGVSDPDDARDDQDEAARKDVMAKLKAMPQSEYQQLVAKADVEEQKDELIEALADEAIEGKPAPSNLRDAIAWENEQHKLAKVKVDAMTADQRKSELARVHAKAAAEEAAAEAEAAKKPRRDRDDSGVSGAAVAVGLVVVLFLVFGIKALIATVIAMGLAYKTAAGSVSG